MSTKEVTKVTIMEKSFNERMKNEQRDFKLSIIKYYIIILLILIVGLTMMFSYYNRKDENKIISTEYREIYDKLINDTSTTSEKIEIVGISNLEEKIKYMENRGYIDDLKLETFFLSVGLLCLIISTFLLVTMIILTFSVKNRMKGLW